MPSSPPPTPGGFLCGSTPPNSPPTGSSPRTPITSPGAGQAAHAFRRRDSRRPRAAFADGDPFLAGGGAVTWSTSTRCSGPTRRTGGSRIPQRRRRRSAACRDRHADRYRLAGALVGRGAGSRGRAGGPRLDSPRPPPRARRADTETLPVATFTVEGVPHALVAARLAARGDRRTAPLLLRAPYLMRSSAWPRQVLALPGRGTPRRPQRRCPEPSGPAPASTPPMATSRGCSTRWPG